uniref:Uncharacterized protein LOC105137787 n=1 Tax=Rhizophora mucronata TaxID=61149 RepID=A0A2P2MIF1_RHIMU
MPLKICHPRQTHVQTEYNELLLPPLNKLYTYKHPKKNKKLKTLTLCQQL